ncbi:MAG: carboxypeptidase-like regulatory domain-containing protein [Planctomycetota bacterium]
MRAALLLLTLLVLAGAGYWLMQSGSETSLPPGGGDVSSAGDGQREAVGELPEGVVATNRDAVEIDPGELADRPTVCLRVIDHRSERPVPGAIVRRLLTGADLAFTDEQGIALVPLGEAAQLAVVRDGYLMRLAPARLGSDEQNPLVVRMLTDAWSTVRRFAFVDAAGDPVADVSVRLRPAPDAQLVDNVRVSTLDQIELRAWSEHLMMAAKEVSRDQHVHAGAEDRHVYHATDAALAVRFVASGAYRLEAATTTGLVATMDVDVRLGPEPPVQVVRMVAGAFVSGVVMDTASAPLAAANVTIQGGDPLGLEATTGDDGVFTIGPLPRGPRTLLVRHAVHKPVAVERVAVPSDDQRIRLEPLQRTPLRGCVRSRPGLQPIAGATLIWQVAGGGAITARTAADGTFELQAAGSIAARLIVQAPRHVTYAELVDPGAAFANYDLLPALTEVRVEHGLTATIEGVAFGANGFPLANASVRWRPANQSTATGMPGRRVLEGGTLELTDVTTTDSAGAFVLETTNFGAGTLTLNDQSDRSLSVTAVAGQRVKGLELGR